MLMVVALLNPCSYHPLSTMPPSQFASRIHSPITASSLDILAETTLSGFSNPKELFTINPRPAASVSNDGSTEQLPTEGIPREIPPDLFPVTLLMATSCLLYKSDTSNAQPVCQASLASLGDVDDQYAEDDCPLESIHPASGLSAPPNLSALVSHPPLDNLSEHTNQFTCDTSASVPLTQSAEDGSPSILVIVRMATQYYLCTLL